jgi:hypothetical protein
MSNYEVFLPSVFTRPFFVAGKIHSNPGPLGPSTPWTNVLLPEPISKWRRYMSDRMSGRTIC